MTGRAPERAHVEVKSRRELRAWLAENHARTDSIWLIHYNPKSEKKGALFKLKASKCPATRQRWLARSLENARVGERTFT